MADISFDDLVPKQSSAPAKGADVSFDDLIPKPTGYSATRTAGESFVRGLPSTGGFWAGAGAGATLAAPVAEAAGVATLPVFPPAAPIVAGALEFGGAMLGGMISSGVVDWATDRLSSIMDPEGYERYKQAKEEHPTAAMAGSVAAGFAGSSYKTAAEVAGKAWTKPIVQRGVSGTLMGGMSAAEQYVETGKVDPTQVAIQAAGGAALPGANVAGRFAQGVGQKIAGAVKGTPKPVATTIEEELKAATTPEERDAILNRIKAESQERRTKAPLVEAAIRNKETGELERMGPKHDQARKEATKDTHEEGFVDSYGVFHERQAAVDQAKRAGQIPEDHVLENPPGEREGLHSGDLRKAGDKRFAVTEDQPAGVPHKPFKDLTAPTGEELYHHLSSAETVGEAYDRLLNVEGLGTKPERALLKLLASHDFIRNADFHFGDTPLMVDNKPARGAYGIDGKHLVSMDKTGDLGTMIHEGFHVGTLKLMFEGKHEAARKLESLYTDFMEAHFEPELAKLYAEQESTLGKPLSVKQKEQIRDNFLETKPYGFTNSREFISEAFINDDMRNLLMSMPSKNKEGVLSNMWQNIKDTIAEHFNIPKGEARTAFDDMMDHTQELLEASKGYDKLLDAPANVVASRLSQEIQNDLQKKGIAVAHSSPHKFGQFNWIDNALKGEGAMAKGAGTYLSTKDSTDKYYFEMAKQRALEKYFEDNPDAGRQYETLEIKQDYVLRKMNQEQDKLSEFQNGQLAEAMHRTKRTFEEYVEDRNQFYDAVDSADPATRAAYEQDAATAQRRLTPLREMERDMQDNVDQLEADYETLKREEKAISDKANKEAKVPTYHSTFETTHQELIDWDATKQSSFVNNVFEKFGIKTESEKLQWNSIGEDRYTATNKDGQTLFLGKRDAGVSEGWYVVDANTGEQIKVANTLEEAMSNNKTGEQLYNELADKFKPTTEQVTAAIEEAKQTGSPLGKEPPWRVSEYLSEIKASIALAEQGVAGNVHNAQAGTETKYRNYVAFDDSKLQQNFVGLAQRPKEGVPSRKTSSEFSDKTSESVAKEAATVDPRSIPNEEQFLKHATDIYEKYGEEEALKFFEDYKKNLNERSIPVPNNNEQLDDMLHKMNTFETKDRSEHVIGYENNTKNGVTPEQRAQWFDMRERGEELPPEAKAILDELDAENIALVRKAKGMGLEVGDEFATGQSRIRLFSEQEKPGWKETIKKFFSNETPMGDKMADQANAAMERKVFGLETWTTDPKVKGAAVKKETGRVIEMHRHPEDTTYSYQDGSGKWQTVPVKKGTSIWEWKDGKKKQIGHSEKLDLKRGDTLELKVSGETPVGADGTKDSRVIKSQAVISDGKVMDIERHSPYRYLHDAEASARLANMGLRKMVREAEAVENLKKSELFKTVGHGPDEDLKTLPKHWVVPNNIDRIPQLRGWHFDPKTAAIISDFAKVWNNGMYMKLSNALVKNMMLNPIPHMFNEVMHLWNARGFTGWLPGTGGLSRLATTGRQAWRDVGQQTQFYRDIMREGGSILGADPRNKGYFETIQKEAQRQIFGTPEMQNSLKQLAKKLGTTTGNLYNSVSDASQKAMWFTRDVMYVQYIREIMGQHEKRTGSKMELKDAIAEAERHMPNYRMPSEVLSSRMLSQVLRDPRVSMFSRYHYGMMRSLINTVKDIDPRNLKTPEGRQHFREGVDSMLAIGVALGVLYPLMDQMAEAVFGEGAEQRRAGPYHMIQAAMDVSSGKKDASALIWPMFTFNPMLLTLGQLAINKKIFTGKEIYHPDDSIGDIASDVGSYAVGQVPQASPVISASTEEGGATKLVARQFDIKAKTEKDLEREARAKAYQQRTKKGRDTKRAKGTYKP